MNNVNRLYNISHTFLIISAECMYTHVGATRTFLYTIFMYLGSIIIRCTGVLDYRGISDVAVFSTNVSEQCFTLLVVDDTAVEDYELLMVFLSLPMGLNNVLLTQQNVTVQIADNDGNKSITKYVVSM